MNKYLKFIIYEFIEGLKCNYQFKLKYFSILFIILSFIIPINLIIFFYVLIRTRNKRLYSIFIGFIYNYIIWYNINSLLFIDYLYIELIYPLYFSFYLLNLFLLPEKIGFRLSYFQERFIFYTGFGLPLSILYYFEFYTFYNILIICLLESKNLKEDNNTAKRDRWLPCCKKINLDIDDFIESLLNKLIIYIEKM